MESLFVILVIGIIFYLYNLYFKSKNKSYDQKFNNYLKTLNSFEIDLDAIKIDGFNWQENVPVDAYDNELDPNDEFLYSTSSYNAYAIKNKFHKNTDKTKFKSRLYIPIVYKGKKKAFRFDVPIEHTVIRMKFYIKKKMTVYVEKNHKEACFILDFNFLENDEISYVTVE